MDCQNRLLRIMYSREKDVLIGSDVRGRIHMFDPNLNLLRSSPVVTYDRPVNAICLTNEYVFTKDRFGSIGKWDIDTLAPLDFYDGRLICNRDELFEGEEPSPSPNRGITVLNGRVYTNNGYGQIVVLDAESFALLDVRPSPSEVFIDCFCTENPKLHAMTDVVGNIFIGNLETNEFPIRRQIDTNVVHGVVYDKRHDRFWTTQDGGLGEDKLVRTGVTVIEKDGSGFKEFKLSHEDNEFIAFDPQCRYLFAGGFNGKIGVFDNETREFRLRKEIGPLEFQIIHAAVVSADQIYALLQTGAVIRLDGDGREVARTNFHNSCVWTLEPHPEDESLLYAGTDEGVTLLRYGPGKHGTVEVEQIDKHIHGRGITKDVRPLRNGSYICVARMGYVLRAGRNGEILWQRQVLGVPRGIAANGEEDRCLVSTDEGTVWELSVADGSVIDRIPVGSPSYACIYTDDGRRVVTADKGANVHVYPADSHDILGSIGFTSRLKRLVRGSNGGIFVAGPDGIFELDLEHFERKKSFGDFLVSTKENAVLCQGHVYAGGYGYQIAAYRYDDSEIVHLEETLPDFTKAFVASIPGNEAPILLVGGRGGFINAYRLYGGIPCKVREFYIR